MKCHKCQKEMIMTPVCCECGIIPIAEISFRQRKDAIIQADCSANNVVTEMALCEVPHILLRPGQLYRFVVMQGCKACEDAAAPYSQNTSYESKRQS